MSAASRPMWCGASSTPHRSSFRRGRASGGDGEQSPWLRLVEAHLWEALGVAGGDDGLELVLGTLGDRLLGDDGAVHRRVFRVGELLLDRIDAAGAVGGALVL